MNAQTKKVRRYGLTAAASLAALAILMLSTNPVNNVIYAVVFFGLLFVMMVSAGLFVAGLQGGAVRPRSRYRIVTISLIALVLLMFASAQSLSWVDGIILILIGFGLVFYISRRS